MISRLTKILLALQILAAIALFFTIKIVFAANNWPAFTLSVAAVFLFRILITANNFLIAWLYSSETPIEHRINFQQTARLFINEFKATMLTSCWTMPFYSFSKRTVKNSTTLPVLLVHGYVCNSGQWHAMSKRLVAENITHHAVDLEPIFGDIDSYVPIIQRAVKILCEETGHDKIILVAHSMGGLAIRAFLRDHGGVHIAKIITVGTPHHGTALSNFGKGLNALQMRWIGNAKKGVSSDWLLKLAAEENQTDYALFVSLYSYHDNIIAPQISSRLVGAHNIAFHGIGHVAQVFDGAIQNQVINEILITSKT